MIRVGVQYIFGFPFGCGSSMNLALVDVLQITANMYVGRGRFFERFLTLRQSFIVIAGPILVHVP